jgi:ketosteroid isomerase-like protein
MSQENVELARQSIEALNRGDLDGALALLDLPPEFEFVPSGVLIPDHADVHRGPEGYRELVEGLLGEFDAPHIEVHELIDAGDRVFSSVSMHGRGKQSGAEVSWRFFQVWEFRDGTPVRAHGFTDEDAALEAAGLSESAMSQENLDVWREFEDAFNRRDLPHS